MVMIGDKIKDSSKTEAEISVEMAKLNPLLVVALKVLVMLVLVLGTKEFRIAITISAFVLLFMLALTSNVFDRDDDQRSESGKKSSAYFGKLELATAPAGAGASSPYTFV
ncbi:hypothetical protein E3N88_27240 [Mikania micrantha]|uniref:Uncharacterized protein n=1 Tax=Mikania micrantha TaxID=192012 RepID=A0A5N6MW44_9ASTR|nr:hypothetical protein E3N88_27240 [Mikania micrantha]